MDFGRVASIGCMLERVYASSIRFNPSLEVSFDCPACKHLGRIIRFADVGSSGICGPDTGCVGFPGRLFSMEPFELGRNSCVKYQVQFDYIPFFDSQLGRESTCEPAWAKITFEVTCAKCNSFRIESSQNDSNCPSLVNCQCGTLLYRQDDAMPLLKTWMGDPT